MKHSFFVALFLIIPLIATCLENAPTEPFEDMEATVEQPLELSPEAKSGEPQVASPTPPLGLNSCIALALARNYAFLAQKNEFEKNKAGVLEQVSMTRPHIRFQDSLTRVAKLMSIGGGKGMSLGEKEVNLASFILTQPLFYFGRLELGIEMVEKQKEASTQALEAKKWDITLDVIRAYLRVLKARNFERIARESLGLLEAHFDLSNKLFKEGVVLKTDVLSTKVKLLEAKQRVIEAVHSGKLAAHSLRHLLVIPENEHLEISPFTVKSAEPYTLEQAVLDGESTPEIRQMKALVEMQGKRKEIERRGNLPAVNLQGQWVSGSQFNEKQKNWSATVVLDVPVFDSGQTRARTRQAQQDMKKTENLMRDRIQRLRLDIRNAFQKKVEMQEMLQVVDETLAASQENFDQISEFYKAGSVLNTDVLEAQFALNNARLNRSNTSFDLLAFEAELLKLAGRLDRFLAAVDYPDNPEGSKVEPL